MSATEAYMNVYPDAAKGTAATAAYQLKQRYQSEIQEHVKKTITYTSGIAVKVLADLVRGKNISEGVKLKAAMAILDYGGFKAPEKKEISVTERSEEEINVRLKQLLKENAIEADIID